MTENKPLSGESVGFAEAVRGIGFDSAAKEHSRRRVTVVRNKELRTEENAGIHSIG